MTFNIKRKNKKMKLNVYLQSLLQSCHSSGAETKIRMLFLCWIIFSFKTGNEGWNVEYPSISKL